MASASSSFTGTFEPVGHCIYCGNKVELTLEHIVPLGLGGNLKLPASSCKQCAKVTGAYIEQACLRKAFYHLRVRHALPTRRPKERKSLFPVEVIQEDGSGIERMIEGGQLPALSWGLPVFEHPGLLAQVAPEKCSQGRIEARMSAADASTLLSYGGNRRPVSITLGALNIQLFSRMLAKIAHSFAYALLGEKGFRPCLQKLILEGDKYPSFFVGGQPEVPPPEGYLYKLQIGEATAWNGYKCLGVKVRLFPFLGTPEYLVAVGEAVGDSLARVPFGSYGRKVKFTYPPEGGKKSERGNNA